jgi:glycosyltransferase involved in cell wall biosynthesis
LLRRTTAWALEQADLVTAASSDLGSAVIQLTDGRVRPLVFQYGLDLQEWRYRERLPTSGVTRIISTRVLGPLYDVETLIRAVPIVQNLAGSVEVVICGDGPLRPSLERLARELGVSSAVRFLGALPAQALGEQLRDADIYVSTSLSDGLSMSLLEGMAIGLYPVVSDIPANRSLITDGGNGSLFRAGDPKHLSFAIVEAMSRPDSRLRAQRQNRAYIEEHADRQTILASFERCYYALAGGETRCGASADARG